MSLASLRALQRAADLPALVALGFAIYFAAIWLLVERVGVMPVYLARMSHAHDLLSSGAGPVDGVVVFGSSVVLEGIDCDALEAELPDPVRCANLAWTGGGPRQWLLLAPSLQASPPRAVVLGLDLFQLFSPGSLPSDRLAIAGFRSFVPAEEWGAYRRILTDDEYAVLTAPRWTHLLRFRGFPLDTLNEHMREVARSDLRYEGHTTNFTAPWVRRAAAPLHAQRVHIDQIHAMLRDGGAENLVETERVLEFLAARIREVEPEPKLALVITPFHPELEQGIAAGELGEVRSSVAALAQRLGAIFIDDSRALPAAGFSDAVHPFASGRTEWSARLGRELATLFTE